MTPEQRERVWAVFDEAVKLPPSERGAFLDAACKDDAGLRAELESLLAQDPGGSQLETNFLKSPVVRGPITVFYDPETQLLDPAADRLAAGSNSIRRIGCYQIVRELGSGGMGTVYEAEQDNPRRAVALKVVRAGIVSRGLVKRFTNEAQILGRLHHPGIAQVYEAGLTEEQQPYFAMELIRGKSLNRHVRDRCLNVAARIELFAQVCDAVQHAHDRGVIHRDLKPGNILVDETGQAKVLDFGVARVTDADRESTGRTEVGDIIGTLAYMSPEQIAADPALIDQRSDVYALGVILFELFADRLPYQLAGLPLPEAARIIHDREPPALGSINALFRGDIETIVAKALEKDRSRRYASAGALAADLRRYLNHEPIRARSASALYRMRKFAQRHKALVGATLAVTLALVAGATVSYLKYRDAQEQKGIAEDKRLAADQARAKAEENERVERWGRYRANIAAAAAALLLPNSGTARSALEDAPAEHRNWEWHYLSSQLDGSTHKLTVPGGKIKALVLSPSGRQAGVCCRNHNEVYLYEVATGKLDAVLRGHSAPVISIAYRPDGAQVASADRDQTIRLWNPATGQPTALLQSEVVQPNPDRNHTLAYNSDGSRIVSYISVREREATSRLWNVATGKEIAVLAKRQEGAALAADSKPIAFSPDGKRVAVCSGEYVYLCDAIAGRQLAVLGPHAQKVNHLAYSADGKRIASALLGNRLASVAHDQRANAIRLWDGESGKEIAALPTPFLDAVLFSPDGSRLISGSAYPDNTARIWDAASGRLLTTLAGHKNGISNVTFSPDGRRALTAALDLTARLWDVSTGQALAVLGGHTGWVGQILFSPDGTRIITASDDATLRYWDAATGDLVAVLLGHGDDFPCPPVFTPDGARLASGCLDGTVRIWDMNLLERNGILKGHESFVYDVAFSPNGEQVASAAWDGSARLWDATTGRQTGVLKHLEKAIFESVSYSRDGSRLATADRERGVTLWDVASQKAVGDLRFAAPVFYESRACMNPEGTLVASSSFEGPVFLWDAATGREVARLVGHDTGSVGVAFHPDGRLLASTGFDRTVRLWDVATRAPVAVLRGHTLPVWRAAFSADGKLLASGSSDKSICLWDAQTYEQLAVIPLGSIVYGVAFSPDGARLAAGCRDNTIRLIDVARRQQVAELRGHTDYVHAVAWSPDGARLVSGSGDFTVRVWDSLSVQERAKRAATK